MKRNLLTVGILLLVLVANFPKMDVSANEEQDEPPSKKVEKIEVTTPDTKLKTHNQIHKKGTPEQLANINERTMKFIKKIALAANESALENDLYASVTIAQAILESDSGDSGLSAYYNNLFGVKGSYKGSTVNLPTYEHKKNGERYKINAYFKVYPSWQASIEDHDYLLKHGLNGFYSGAWKSNTESYKDATQYLQGRYATDVNYASKLNRIIENYNLTRFDNPLTKRDKKWLESDSLDPWELPIVPPKMSKKKTWSSAYSHIPKEFEGLKVDFPKLEPHEEIPTDLLYVNTRTGISLDTETEDLRYKNNPKVGDVAVFLIKNSEGELVPRYGYIEEVREERALITEAVTVGNKITYVYRVVEEGNVRKLEFIDVKKTKKVQEERVEQMNRMLFINR